MPTLVDRDVAIAYLQRYLTGNKARGMVAEIALDSWLTVQDEPDTDKVLPGVWLVAPNVLAFHRSRYAVYVLPRVCTEAELRDEIGGLERSRPFRALSTYLWASGIGVVVAAAVSESPTPDMEDLNWVTYVLVDERFRIGQEGMPFRSWPGRGRPSRGDEWPSDVLRRFEATTSEQLTALALRQAFFYGFLKQELRISVADPYDVDCFVVGYRGNVMPVEVKEKSPTTDRRFGLDAGRILMMLRLCLATDSNAMYLIREVDESPQRDFRTWRYITLSDIVMGCRWNLQAGGRGMGGGATQTVMMSGELFGEFNARVLSEEWLAQNSSLQESVRNAALDFANDLDQVLRDSQN